MAQTQNTNTQVGHTEPDHGGGFPPFNPDNFSPQLVWLAICFIGLYLFLSRVALPRIATVIEQRKDRISRDLDEAQRLKDETEKAIANYEQALAEARANAQTIAQEARNELQTEVDKERAEVERQISEKLVEAEKRITTSKTAALSQVSDVANETTEALVEKLIGADIKKQDITKAVEASIKTIQGT